MLRYRGYSIEDLGREEQLPRGPPTWLINGELPSESELADWIYEITHHTIINEKIKRFLDGFHYNAHPMGILVSAVAALSTFLPEIPRGCMTRWCAAARSCG